MPLPALSRLIAAGVVGSAAAVIGLTGAGAGDLVALPAGPLRLWQPAAHGHFTYAVVALSGVTALVLAFVGLYRLAGRQQITARQVAVAAGLWCAPVLLAQPLLSLDAFSYLAQGQMLVAGLDPYVGGPDLLGPGPLLDSVAPVWRATPAPYGPLSLSLLHGLAAATGGHRVPFILALRLLIVASVVASGVVAARLARPDRSAAALALVVANPIVVLHLVGGVHLDALIGALGGVVVLAVRRRRWWAAALGAATAFALKVPGLVLLGYVLLRRAMDTDGPPGRRLLRAAARAGAVAAVAAAAVFAYALLIPDGWGWVRVLDTPGKVRHVYALPYLLAGAGYGVLRLVSVEVDFVQALSVGRGISAAAGALVVLALLVRASRSGGDWRRAGALVGGALTAIVLTAPVLHAWYVSWGLVLVAACAGDAARRLLLLLCVALCFTAMPGELVHSHAGLALNLALLAAAVVITLLATRPTNAPAPEPPDACAGEAPELVTAEPAAAAPGAR